MDALSHLHLWSPSVRSVGLFAIVALLILHNKLHLECLLQHRVVVHFLLNGEFHRNTPTVRLCVDKLCVQQLNLLQSLHLLQADGQQLGTLKFTRFPSRSIKVPVTFAAMAQIAMLRDSFSDVDGWLETRDTSVRSVGFCHDSADTTSDLLCCEHLLVSYLNTTVSIFNRAIVHCFVQCVFVVVQFERALTVNLGFEQNIIFLLLLSLVNIHFPF